MVCKEHPRYKGLRRPQGRCPVCASVYREQKSLGIKEVRKGLKVSEKIRGGFVEKPPVEKPPVEKPPVEKPPVEKPQVKTWGKLDPVFPNPGKEPLKARKLMISSEDLEKVSENLKKMFRVSDASKFLEENLDRILTVSGTVGHVYNGFMDRFVIELVSAALYFSKKWGQKNG